MGGGKNFTYTKRTNFNNPDFNFSDARDIFKQFFGGKDPFENFGKGFGFDDDDIFKDMRKGFGKSPFEDDDFFKGIGSSNFMTNKRMSGMGGMSGIGGMGNNNSIQNMGGNLNGNGFSKKTSIKKTTQTMYKIIFNKD
jgi:DnaJ family protein B protein 6